jgi:hypothetical protein
MRKSGRLEKRACLIGLVIILTVLVIAIVGRSEWFLDHEGDSFSTLAFVDSEETVEEKLIPYYSEENNIYYLFLPSYANQQNVTIYFEGAKEAVFRTGEASLEMKRGETIEELAEDTLYELSFENGEGNTATAGFQIMHSANLPALFVETESGTMDTVDADKANEESGRYALVDADGRLIVTDKLSHITGRGNSTWIYPKKSYSIKLKSDADLLGMGSADSWILLSNVEDTTYLKNKITYDMAIAAGMTGATDSRYIDLYINHEYNGMYLLCEKIEADENRIPMTNLDEENERLNKNIEQLETVAMDDGKCVRLDTNPKDITGGYILERDVSEKYDAEVSGLQSALLGDLYTIKSPEYASVEETEYVKDLINGMERAVVSEDGIDPETGKSLSDYIDLKSFAQKYLIEEICKNNGGGATSSYFYKPQDSISTRLFAGPVWDYDKAYGRLTGFNGTTRDLCYLTQRESNTTLFWYLNQNQEFRDAVKECYRDFFSDYVEELIDGKIADYASEIYVSAAMDTIRWEKIYGDIGEYVKRPYAITDFLTERKVFLDQVWLGDAELKTVHFVAPEWKRDVYMSVIAGECFEAVPILEQGYQGMAFDGWYNADGVEFDITQPITEDMTVYASSHVLDQE